MVLMPQKLPLPTYCRDNYSSFCLDKKIYSKLLVYGLNRPLRKSAAIANGLDSRNYCHTVSRN